LVALVAFVCCANVSVGIIPTNDIVKMTEIMLEDRIAIVS
jgi:hypothetical protein